MNRFVITQNSKGTLLVIYDKKVIYYGMEAINFINSLISNKKIISTKEPINNVLDVQFEDVKIVIDYQKIPFNYRNYNGLKPLFYEIKQFENEKNTLRSKKVNRINKYSRSILISASLVAAVALAITIHSNAETKDLDDELYLPDYNTVEYADFEENHEDLYVMPSSVTTVENNIDDNIDFVGFAYNYENRSNTDKAINCRNEYGEKIKYYADMYGVDPNILLAIATQERGVHSTEIDNGGAVGLMQVQYGVWIGQEISAYNFYTGTIDKFVVTDEMLRSLDTNIQLGAIILQLCFLEFNNPIAAVQAYNYGGGCVKSIIEDYAYKTYGEANMDIVFVNNDYNWTSPENITIYKNGYIYGDNEYLNHVFSYLSGDVVSIEFKNVPKYDSNGNIVNNYSIIVSVMNNLNDRSKTTSL